MIRNSKRELVGQKNKQVGTPMDLQRYQGGGSMQQATAEWETMLTGGAQQRARHFPISNA